MSKLTECKACGTEIAKSAKACPHCGAKSKKPIFKRWWFWVIVAAALIGATGGEDETNAGSIVSSGPAIENTVEVQPPQTTDAPEKDGGASVAEKNALRAAKNYLSFSAFSYEGLICQLEFEGYTTAEATYAAGNCGADWNEQALKSAKNYLSFSTFSYEGLIDQLEFEKFTAEQATYGADHCGADWYEQAAKCAKNYLELTAFSREGLIDQLLFEGFTQEQAVYGVEQNGF